MPGVASCHGGPRRVTSRRACDSTRITVAPWSARYLTVIGPTPTHEKSSTFKPASGSSGSTGNAISDDPRAAERIDFGRRVATQALVHRPVVRTGCGRRPWIGEGGRGQAGERSGVADRSSEHRVVDRTEERARRELRVRGDVGHGGHRRDQDAAAYTLALDLGL